MRQVVFDTETTGIGKGHRIIEIGCVEIIDRVITGKHLHHYVNPKRSIDQAAYNVHGISGKILKDKPLFHQVSDEIIDFISGSVMIAHNASFDQRFWDLEFELAGKLNIESYCDQLIDSLKIARERYPGKKNNLDALCKRLNIDNSSRKMHGALMDARILAEVYLAMTSEQVEIKLFKNNAQPEPIIRVYSSISSLLTVILATKEEVDEHERIVLFKT